MEYRFYGFGNYYLSSLQQGLQSAHVIGELFVQNRNDPAKEEIVYDWATNHKTMVLLNGGNSLMLQETFDFFTQLKEVGMPLPFAKFHEDAQSLGGALTYVGMIVPAHIYELASILRMSTQVPLEENTWEVTLARKLNEFRLAN